MELELPESILARIEEWMRKSVELAYNNNDWLITGVAQGFADIIAMTSKKYNIEHIQCNLILLAHSMERDKSLNSHKVKNDHLRDFLTDLREIIHLILSNLADGTNQVKMTEEIPNSASSIPIQMNSGLIENHDMDNTEDYEMFIEEEKMDDDVLDNTQPIESREDSMEEVIPVDNQNSHSSLDEVQNVRSSMGDDLTEKEGEEEKGLRNATDAQKSVDDLISSSERRNLSQYTMRDGMDDGEMEKETDNIADAQNITEEKKGKRPSRKVSKVVNYVDSLDDSNDDCEPEVKKSRSKSVKGLNMNKSSPVKINDGKSVKKMNESDLECPECQFHTRSVDAWDDHLRRQHSTNPILAGLALLCDCGQESYSKRHRKTCDIANFTIIRKRDGPIRRVNVKNYVDSNDDSEPEVKKFRSKPVKGINMNKSSPVKIKDGKSVKKVNESDLECPECEFRTRSVPYWLNHLRLKHSTTPIMAGLSLLCDCGNESFSRTHRKTCDVANFTIIRKRDGPIMRVNVKETPQCVVCEMYPKTARGYVDHLRKHHGSTLKENKVYLKCSCGLEIHYEYGGTSKFIHGKECDPRLFSLHKLDDN